MKLTQTLKDVFGNDAKQKYPLVDEDGNPNGVEYKILTLGQAIKDSVLLEGTEVKTISEEEHLMRYSIYERVGSNEEVEFTQEEIDFIKVLVSRRYLPIYAGQLLRMLSK